MFLKFYRGIGVTEEDIEQVFDDIRKNAEGNIYISDYCGGKGVTFRPTVSIKKILISLVQKYPNISFSASESFDFDGRDSSFWTEVTYRPEISEDGEVIIKEDSSTQWN